MTLEIRVPRLAESISEATLVEWLKPDGAAVRTDEPIATLETDKAAVEIVADGSGALRHAQPVGATVKVGDLLARIEEGAAGAPAAPASAAAPAAPATARPA
ncbi:MAG TPA: biotin/lipoyl-containing protein, partial [Candidatus Eisenbacteria bacterium]|nr:biotin/lipoyl-containing protein [Candidatus Eisenbacteria bacterium]